MLRLQWQWLIKIILWIWCRNNKIDALDKKKKIFRVARLYISMYAVTAYTIFVNEYDALLKQFSYHFWTRFAYLYLSNCPQYIIHRKGRYSVDIFQEKIKHNTCFFNVFPMHRMYLTRTFKPFSFFFFFALFCLSMWQNKNPIEVLYVRTSTVYVVLAPFILGKY